MYQTELETQDVDRIVERCQFCGSAIQDEDCSHCQRQWERGMGIDGAPRRPASTTGTQSSR